MGIEQVGDLQVDHTFLKMLSNGRMCSYRQNQIDRRFGQGYYQHCPDFLRIHKKNSHQLQ